MVFRDPPEHGHIRRLVSRAFTAPALASFEPLVAETTDELLSGLLKRGSFDLIADFAYLLPVSVIARLLGVAAEDRDLFVQWSAAISESMEPRPTEEQVAQANAVVLEFKSYFLDLVAKRCKRPRDDLISLMLAADLDSQNITELGLLHNTTFLLTAGHETTSSLIGGGTLSLLRFPDQAELLAKQPDLVGLAVEELLRYDSPNQIGGRLILTDMEFQGVKVPAGTFVWISNGAANRPTHRRHGASRPRTGNPHARSTAKQVTLPNPPRGFSVNN